MQASGLPNSGHVSKLLLKFHGRTGIKKTTLPNILAQELYNTVAPAYSFHSYWTTHGIQNIDCIQMKECNVQKVR